MDLAHRIHRGATGRRVAFLLHGFLGQGRNWESIARRLVERCPDWTVVTPDLRLHGDSQDAPPPHTLAACAADLRQLADRLGVVPEALLGHSFGGKVVLALLPQVPTARQVWVLDSTPRPMRPMRPGGSAWEMLARLDALPGPFPSRGDAVAALSAAGLAQAEAQWVATNLVRAGDALRWRLNLPALRELITDFYAADLWPVVEAPPPETAIHFVAATRSDVLPPADLARLGGLAARGVYVHPLESGHWVNADDPDGLLALLVSHLDAPSPAPGP